jgi:hypothetical protein
MNTASSVSTFQQIETCKSNAGSTNGIWAPLDLLAEESASLAKWRSFAVDGNAIPSYVFIGPRAGSVPIRLALLGGFGVEDLVSTSAIVKLLIELDLAPLLARDFALFSYPVANPGRVSSRPPDFSTGFWTGAPKATIRYLEQEFARNHPDGIIAAKGNEAISGFQMQVSSRLIATEVLWPAVEIVQRLVPLANEPVQTFPQLQANSQLGPASFSLIIRTPRRVPSENQISAIAFSVKQILRHYRVLVSHADEL